MYKIVKKGTTPQRECIRMDSLFRGPIHSSFTMIVNGLVTLRSYERIEYFRQKFIDDLEKSSNVTFSLYASNRWVGIHLDLICVLFTLCASSISFYMKDKISIGVIAFSLQILTDVVIFFSFSFRMAA